MSEVLAPPAETYKLNVLASSLGRFAVNELDPATKQQAREELDYALDDLLKKDVPPVPHTDHHLILEAETFANNLAGQTLFGAASKHITETQLKTVSKVVGDFLNFCEESLGGNIPRESWVNPQAIADAYGLPDLFKVGKSIVEGEQVRFGWVKDHPPIHWLLKEKVDEAETAKLLDFMWLDVIGVYPNQPVDIYLTDKPQNYHVYWAPKANGLDYTTPATYDRATQLSFDLPHNAAHLIHLNEIENGGAARYTDKMQERAYFEAVAVLSEYVIASLAQSDDFGESLAGVYGLKEKPWGRQLAEWIRRDRAYEFKLRAVRYAADLCMIEGMSFNEAVEDITNDFIHIPKEEVETESLKYLPWTGLGSVYTHGYRKLLDNNSWLPNAFYSSNAEVIRSW